MLPVTKQPTLNSIELVAGISVQTNLPLDQIPALRAGFMGYPHNPRWTARKYHAWKTGCQWRTELATGDKVVRDRDALLVNTSELEATLDSSKPTAPAPEQRSRRWRLIPVLQ
ncbi:hypothetical protein [Spirulina major]|uniref:hypothetical protein n=1 Tax=Spirulina major TaxID=270636 RepID=UPI000934FDFB|nr:hypothetical protein [Spirulina major]